MKHIVYRTTNKINGKIYIGKHSTEDLDDGYLGSGTMIRQAVKKYGKENFHREILFAFDDEKDAMQKEAELVSTEFVRKDSNYNRIEGGGGCGIGEAHGMYGKTHSDETKKIMSEKKKGENHPYYGKKRPKEVVEKISKSSLGKKLSEEHKDKLREVNLRKTLSEQHKEKIGDSLRGRFVPKEQAERAREAKRARNPMYLPENLGLLRFLKSEGFSSAKIAEQLNDLGIPKYKDKAHTKNSVEGVFKYI